MNKTFFLSEKLIALTIIISFLLTSIVPQSMAFAAELPLENWDILNEEFTDYGKEWNISKGKDAKGEINQSESFVTIKEHTKAENYAWHYLIQNNFPIPEEEFTFEFKAKVNSPSTGNQIGVRLDGKIIALYLSFDGEKGFVRDRLNNPTNKTEVDVSRENIYQVNVHKDLSYDVYVNGVFLWEGKASNESGGPLIKIGTESSASADMDIHYFKMANGLIIPENDETVFTKLENLIIEAEEIVTNSIIGTEPGQYPETNYNKLVSKIEEAKLFLKNNPSESKVNEMFVTLENEINLFVESQIKEIIDEGFPEDFPVFKFEKIVIDPSDMKYNPTNEYDFPTVIKASDYFENPLGKYYMYYGPHDSPGGIALAYADSLEGPWVEYEDNPIIKRNTEHYNVSHVASAHPIWIEEEEKLFLYFHGENNVTRLATSDDGINFEYEKIVVDTTDFNNISEASYARVFKYTIPSKGNKYTMLLMGNNNGSRKIYLAWSDDGKNWSTKRDPIISPIRNESIDHQGNLSGAYYFPWNDRHFVTVHASSGNQYLVEVGENFDQEIHHGVFNKATGEAPDYGRVASRSFISEGENIYMFYEVGQRGSTKIALAKSLPQDKVEDLSRLTIKMDKTIIQSGDTMPIKINAINNNFDEIEGEDLEIEYFTSEKSIATFKDNKVYGHRAGVTDIWINATYRGKTLESNKLTIEVRDGEIWDIFDDGFINYKNSWDISKGAKTDGEVTQKEDYVTIKKLSEASTEAWYYLTNNNFNEPNREFTIEFKAKINSPSSGNQIGVRLNGKLFALFLGYEGGGNGAIRDRLNTPNKLSKLNTSQFNVYRMVVHDNSEFDVYVNGEFAWSSVAGNESGDKLIKIGSESTTNTDMDIKYFRMNNGQLLPEESEQIYLDDLEKSIQDAEKLIRKAITDSKYPKESIELLIIAIENAKSLLLDNSISQSQIDDEVIALMDAIDQFVASKKEEALPVNISILEKLIELAKSKMTQDYTHHSILKLKEAIKKAEKSLEFITSEEMLNHEIQALELAMHNLVKITEPNNAKKEQENKGLEKQPLDDSVNEEDDNKESKDSLLPNTSTTIYNVLLLGFILLSLGLIIQMKKRSNLNI